MIDHLGVFADEGAAKADPVWGVYWLESKDITKVGWRANVCSPNVIVWDPAQDIQLENGGIEHVPYAGWRLLVSLSEQDLDLTATAELVTDRTAALAGQPCVLSTSWTPEQLGTLLMQPIFAGMQVYPYGEGSPVWDKK